MKKEYPPAEYAFRYREPPLSGNIINGLGEADVRRARQIFHGSGERQLEWSHMESFFALTMPFRIFWQELRNYWTLRKADGRVAKVKLKGEPLAFAKKIKQVAMHAGAGGVGISRITEQSLYENCDKPFEFAISILLPMDPEEMQHIPEERAAREVLSAYFKITVVAIKVAKAIRDMGWPARAYGESADFLHLPTAVNAGLGELGKHGSLISRQFGPNVRLATVLTNLPMAIDAPVDIGVEDLCAGCRRCTIDCPADAISDQKQVVRGVNKWYVDFDRCVPYFAKTIGCGICIEVCPWTRTGRGPSLSEKLLAKRRTRQSREQTND